MVSGGRMICEDYSDPMNRRLRQRFGDGADRLGSVVEEQSPARASPSPLA